MLRLLFLFCIINFAFAQGLPEESSLFIYNDGTLDSAFKDLQRGAKEQLKEKEISWKSKSNNSASWLSLKDNVEKDLLKKKADYYLLSLGLNDIWDKRKKQVQPHQSIDLQAAIDDVIAILSKAEKQIILCTIQPMLEETNPELNSQVEKLNAFIKAYAKKENVHICDIHTPLARKIKNSEPAKRGKGITTKDGFKIEGVGSDIVQQTAASLIGIYMRTDTSLDPVKLNKKDYIVIACGHNTGFPVKDFNEASKAKYGTKWKFESPRVATITLQSWEMFQPTSPAKKLLGQKGNHYFLLPTFAHSDPRFSKPFKDGTYKPKFIELIKEMKEKTNAKLYLVTWVVWNEANANNSLVIDGPYYQESAKWANVIREIGKETGLPVLDLHQRCMDIIAEKGPEGLCFGGQSYSNDPAKTQHLMSKQGAEIFAEEICKLFNIEMLVSTK